MQLGQTSIWQTSDVNLPNTQALTAVFGLFYNFAMTSQQDRFNAELGRRIAFLRQRAHLTQDALARALDLSRTSVVNIEAGRQAISALKLVEIAEAVGISDLRELVGPVPRQSKAKIKDDAAKRAWVSKLVPEFDQEC